MGQRINNGDGNFRGFNAGCIDPQAHMEELLSGRNPDYGVDKKLPASMVVSNATIQELGIPDLSDTVPSMIERVAPFMDEGNSRTMTPFTGIVDGAGNLLITLSNFIFRFFAIYFTYQISALAGVLTNFVYTRTGVDGLAVPPAQGSVVHTLNGSCLNSTEGSEILVFETRTAKNQAGTANSCNGQTVGVAKCGELTGNPPIVAAETVALSGATPGASGTFTTINNASQSWQRASSGFNDVFAQSSYRKIASLIARDMKQAKA